MSVADLRHDLIAAARAELAERGSADLSLRAVARRAGVSHAAPAYHFTDKAGLLTAVAAEGFRELAAEMDEPLAEDQSVVAVLGQRYLRFARRNPALYELMFRPEELRADDAQLAAAKAASLRRLAVAAESEGGRVSDLAVISWAFAHGVATLSGQGALAGLRPDLSPDAIADALLASFAALIAPPGPR